MVIGSVAFSARSTSRATPSSRTTKSAGVRPVTGEPSLSRTLTNIAALARPWGCWAWPGRPAGRGEQARLNADASARTPSAPTVHASSA